MAYRPLSFSFKSDLSTLFFVNWFLNIVLLMFPLMILSCVLSTSCQLIGTQPRAPLHPLRRPCRPVMRCSSLLTLKHLEQSFFEGLHSFSTLYQAVFQMSDLFSLLLHFSYKSFLFLPDVVYEVVVCLFYSYLTLLWFRRWGIDSPFPHLGYFCRVHSLLFLLHVESYFLNICLTFFVEG